MGLGEGGLMNRANNLTHVFDDMQKRKRPAASPRAAIVKEDRVPARATNRLGEIEISLVAWKAM